MRSGKDANALADMLPTKDRENFLAFVIKNNGLRSAAVVGQNAMQTHK